jgi:hypothetical protein
MLGTIALPWWLYAGAFLFVMFVGLVTWAIVSLIRN